VRCVIRLFVSVAVQSIHTLGLGLTPVRFASLFHRLTRTAYLYNGCLPWYNVVLTSRVHSSAKYSQQSQLRTRALNHCLSWSKFVSTHLSHSRQWFNIHLYVHLYQLHRPISLFLTLAIDTMVVRWGGGSTLIFLSEIQQDG